eukprot:gb/GECG01008400.1/.p1 GENE.gb/GECG01008400.1/~~gb/GECG01008400.1/.p1  ORF type:complete len:302 (+),score=22.81 gb/GECG01008400.1/:1-906(+)
MHIEGKKIFFCLFALAIAQLPDAIGGGWREFKGSYVYHAYYQRTILRLSSSDFNASVSSAYQGWFWVPPERGAAPPEVSLYGWRIDTLGPQSITEIGVAKEDGSIYHDTYFESQQNGRSCATGVTANSLRGLNITAFLSNQNCDISTTINITRPWSKNKVLCCKCTLPSPADQLLYRKVSSDGKSCRQQDPVAHAYTGEGGLKEIVTFETFKNKTGESLDDQIFQRPSYCAVNKTNSSSNPTVAAWVWIVVACGVCVILGVLGGFYIGQKKGKKIARERRPKRSIANESHGGYNTALLDMM